MKTITQRRGEAETQSEYVTVRFRMWMIDVLWLVGVGIYILAGTGLATFHGDEAMQITMSEDYATAILEGQPSTLSVQPPYIPDSPEWLRLINGSVNRYAIGLSWHVAWMDAGDLPGLWQWPLSYEDNVAQGNRPSDTLLSIARLPSALFLALSVAVMFGIGWKLGKRPLAYVVSGLYAANPVILLNGRRAMQEGSFLFFGLLTVLIAIVISQQQADRRRIDSIGLWTGLIVAGGLTLASKHSGIVFVAGAFGWILVAKILSPLSVDGETETRRITARLFTTVGKMIISGGLVVALFVALSPALWNDPVARLGDLVSERQKLLESQVVASPDAPTSIGQRIEGIITQPFIAPAEQYEASFWGGAETIRNEIDRYMTSPFSGLQFGAILGGTLTLLAGWGLVRAARGQVVSWGLLAWLAVTVANLLINPLPWQRYYLPLLPIVTLLAGIGLVNAVDFVKNRLQSKSPLVA